MPEAQADTSALEQQHQYQQFDTAGAYIMIISILMTLEN
jgi:hypothetical protein